MSEKIYAWLLRLYPSHFRRQYGAEALQLFRDRSRDERGLLPGFRLWFDLLADIAVSLPREYRRAEPAISTAPVHTDGLPGFRLLEGEAPRPGIVISALVLTLAGFAAASILISYGDSHTNPHFWESKGRAQRPDPSARASSAPSGSPSNALSSDQQSSQAAAQQQRSTASPATPDAGRLQSDGGAAQGNDAPAQAPQPVAGSERSKAGDSKAGALKAGAHAKGMITSADSALDAAERKRVVQGAVAQLDRYYNYPDVARKVGNALLAHEVRGDNDIAADGQTFAALINAQMLDASHDGQLRLVYSKSKLAPVKAEPSAAPFPELLAQYRKTLEAHNCFFEKVQILPHNVGYFKLNALPDPSVCGKKAADAMLSLNHTDAIIFDLRDNTGGYPAMVSLLAGYLFDKPTQLSSIYNRAENSMRDNWTPQPVPGNTLAKKPVFILTSGKTFSGAEQFSYDMQMLKRATIVGEPTSGRGHIPRARRIDDHFEIRVPDEQTINPVSKTGWDGPGVQPDVTVRASEALATAQKLAVVRLRRR
jgi:Peptidase family S41